MRVSKTLRNIADLSSSEREALFRFFDEIEERVKDVFIHIQSIVAYELVEDGDENREVELFREVEGVIRNFNLWCHREIIRLGQEGVPSNLSLPVVQYATEKAKEEFEKRVAELRRKVKG